MVTLGDLGEGPSVPLHPVLATDTLSSSGPPLPPIPSEDPRSPAAPFPVHSNKTPDTPLESSVNIRFGLGSGIESSKSSSPSRKKKGSGIPRRYLLDLVQRCGALLAVKEFLQKTVVLNLEEIPIEEGLDDGFGIYEIVAEEDPSDENDGLFLARFCCCRATSESEVCCWFGWCVLEGFSQSGALVVLVEVLPGPACVVSAVLLAVVFSLMVRVVWSFGLCVLVKVLPRIALVASGGGSSQECSAFVSGYRCVALWFDVCRLVGLCSGEVLPGRLLALFGGDELSLLPVGLSVLQSAWAFSVKVLCAWPCVWLLRWPACLVVRFQVSRLRWRDLRVPVARMICLVFCALRALADGGLVSAVGARMAVLLVEAPVLRCGLPLPRGRDSLRCMSPSSVFHWLLEVVMLHYGVLLGCASLRPFGGVIFP
ncbi:hypothetical protein Taro_001117 [Colocasia esculenta]|uniref:Uncharacterized protein n=1 Tax=Colocasia esculenta TaxID=4460 RepID=A0A843TJQ3_COLES|nr:hypothetical protein [Colocasia esculenta]